MTVEGAEPPARRLGGYELLRPIAQGGMADVYFAHRAEPQDDRPLAIKLLQHRWARSPEARAMFLDEARLVALLHHQHIAQVHEVGIADGRHYQVMEYVHGVDLRGLLAAALRASVPAPLPLPTAAAIVCAAAAGLDHAHRRCGPDGRPLQLIHRDVSLSNIMVGYDGSVKLIDFGIATTTIASVPMISTSGRAVVARCGGRARCTDHGSRQTPAMSDGFPLRQGRIVRKCMLKHGPRQGSHRPRSAAPVDRR
jgi:serine/threonine protein kinase